MPLNQPLVGLLSDSPDRARRVAFGAGGERSHALLLADVFALANRLRADRDRRWLVESEDAYRIAVALLAAAVVGARVALPPNLQAETLAELRAVCERVFVDAPRPGDDDTVIDPLAPGRSDEATTRMDRAATPLRIDREAALVDLYTSGTSGPGKLVTKALRHLEDEVVELERSFGEGLGRGTAVLATVSAHHLYGLLFRVLWPLATARPFARANLLMPEELLARIGDDDGAVVVSSPAHLRHLASSPRLGDQASRIRAVFSSGGPLETRTALRIEAAVGAAPIEIFGSTETGGVASRRATSSDPSPPWKTFAPVILSVAGDDGRITVTSPFVTAPVGSDTNTPSTWCMGDRVEPGREGFRLLGRSDRIAKIGEKTLSLPEIEAHLAAHEFVDAAATGIFSAKGGPRLGAIVVLGAAGRRRLAEAGRRALQAELVAYLAGRWDRVVLPRRWRFRDCLPVDARGKFSRHDIETELARAVDEPLAPLLIGEHRDGDDIVLELVVPRDLAYLDGHYESFPLVPGAAQIHWVMSALGRVVGRRVSAQRMEAVKFKNVLRPAQCFTMRLRVDAPRATFTLADGARVFSSGRITLNA